MSFRFPPFDQLFHSLPIFDYCTEIWEILCPTFQSPNGSLWRTYEFTYCFTVCESKTVDPDSPTNAVLDSSCQFFSSAVHSLQVFLQFPVHCVIWSSFLHFTLRIPSQGLPRDAVRLFQQCMSRLSPACFPNFLFSWKLGFSFPQSVIAYGIRPTDLKYLVQIIVYKYLYFLMMIVVVMALENDID